MEEADDGKLIGAGRNSQTRNKTFAFVNNKRKLVRLYMQNRFLWDSADARYSNRTLKERALSNIADSFGVSVAEIKAEIHILRTQFFREVRKTNRKRLSDEYYVSKWYFYEELLPLQGTVKVKKLTIVNQSTETGSAGASASVKDNGPKRTGSSAVYLIRPSAVDAEKSRAVQSPAGVPSLMKTQNITRTTVNHATPRCVPVRVTPTTDSPVANSLEKLVEVGKCLITQDYWQHFGNFVAADLRRKPPELAEIQRNKICALLLDLALPTYESNASESHDVVVEEEDYGTIDAEEIVEGL